MNHEPLRIQPEGRAVKVHQEKGSGANQCGQGKASKTRKARVKTYQGRPCTCQGCGVVFFTKKSRNETPKNCSMECFRKGLSKWKECSKCHALMGLGCRKSSKILGMAHTTISAYWVKAGIKSQCPERSWNVWARRHDAKGKEWWEDDSLLNAWKKEQLPKFQDWSVIWRNEKSRRKYASLTEEQKKNRNRRNMISCRESKVKSTKMWKRERMKDPGYRAKEYAKIRQWYIEKTGGREAYESRKATRMSLIGRGKKVNRWRSAFSKLMRTVKKGGADIYSPTISCTTKQLRDHLESQFRSWMTWENYGKRWQVDHIIPCAAFDHSIQSHAKQCWHFLNLRPMCAKKNHQKSDTITEPQLSLLIEYV